MEVNKKFNQQFSIVNLGQQDVPYVNEDVKSRTQWVSGSLEQRTY